MNIYDWSHLRHEDGLVFPQDLTPQAEKRRKKLCKRMLAYEAHLLEKRAKQKTRKELRAAEKALQDAPK